ncbi:biotin/lipoyl-containing protein [Butyrivibrio sp. JL13D10]|uniref:biotin/lipoyl-containing protein n=1 Tax=Butyrivibrio sp. JL13D10 TaxID=3236815 RepID=UPI0038B430F5
MKNYTITVNGNVYEVTVEEGAGSGAPVAAPKAPAAPAKKASAGAGGVKVTAGAAGKVLKIEANVGQAVKKGDAVVVMESMKMEIPMVAPQDGTIASIDVAVGDQVEAGGVVATMN